MGDFLIVLVIGSIIAFVYMVIGTIVITFIFGITDPDDNRYMLTFVWPAMCICWVAEQIESVTMKPIIERMTYINRKRLIKKEEKDV